MEKKLQALLNKYHRNECTDEEIRRLEAWFEEIATGRTGEEPHEQTISAMLAAIKRSPRFSATPAASYRTLKASILRYSAIAASAVFLLAASTIIYRHTHTESDSMANRSVILPASDKAVLTLADGTRIALNDRQEGLISEQDGITISKNKEGALEYRAEARGQMGRHMINTLATPRGGSYQIVLPDGSKAWLNAASSLSYPMAFGKHERRVQMTGEVYFEITKSYVGNEPVPFLVETAKQTIQVLGTQFNVNSYANYSAERTTLVEGKVKVIAHATGDQKLISPHMQAKVAGSIHVEKADVSRNVAWKNGDFIFRNEPLSEIIEEVMRWYDVDVICPEHLGQIRFNGMVSRKQPLSAVIDMIAATDKVKLEVKERRIIIR